MPPTETQILDAYRLDPSVRRVARTLKCRDSVVSSTLNASGVTLSPGGKRKFPPEIEQEIAVRYQGGSSVLGLSKAYGATMPAILGCIRRQGVEVRPMGRPAFWTSERDREVLARVDAGESSPSVAVSLGVSTTAIRRALRRLRPERQVMRKTNWRGGTIIVQGYRAVTPTIDDLKFCVPQSNGYVMEHRLVAGRFVGRPLGAHETVHHINGDKFDNRVENLQIRQGQHGRGAAFACGDCGSINVMSVALAENA